MALTLFATVSGLWPDKAWTAATIVTAAGGGKPDGLVATQVDINPYGVAVDGLGRFYVSDQENDRVLRIEPGSLTVVTVAGNGTAGQFGDGGPATAASLIMPAGMDLDRAGNLYIADSGNHRVRRVDVNGIITTFAGIGSPGRDGDGGPATQAGLNTPQDVAVDADGNVYIADVGNNRIRRVDARSGVITTVAGSSNGFSGDGGPAVAAKLSLPFGVGIDSQGRLLVADSMNNRIRRVDLTGDSVITTLAGNSTALFGGDGLPALSTGLDFPLDATAGTNGDVLLVDSMHLLRIDTLGIIHVVAGGSNAGYAGDGGAPARSLLNAPSTIALAISGDIYIADAGNRRVRRIRADGQLIETVAGTGRVSGSGDGLPVTRVILNQPSYTAADGEGGFFLVERRSNKIRHVDGATTVVTSVVGTGEGGFSGDSGPAAAARLSTPGSVSRDVRGNLYIADSGNNRVRKVLADGAGHVGANSTILTIGGGGAQLGDGGPATQARLSSPMAAVADADGNVYVADSANNRIRRIDAKGTITTVAGTGRLGYGGDGGPAPRAALALPWDVALDGSGHLYIADLQNNRIRRVDLDSGLITTAAGSGTLGFGGDGGPAIDADLATPSGVAVDAAGNLFIADANNVRVRRVDMTTGIIDTVAGTGVRTGFIDGEGGDPSDDLHDGGLATAATFRNPAALSFENSRSLLVSDPDLGRIRRVAPIGDGGDPSPSPSPSPSSTPTPTLTLSPSPVPTATLSRFVCACDCDGQGGVSVDEAVMCVSILLGDKPLSACPHGDANQDGSMEITDVISGIIALLAGPSCEAVVPR